MFTIRLQIIYSASTIYPAGYDIIYTTKGGDTNEQSGENNKRAH